MFYLFSSLLIVANVYFFVKKKYIYLFIPCILFLPDYYGIDFSNSLPIITVSRLMYLIFFLYALLYHKRRPSFKDIKSILCFREYRLLVIYFLFRIISNLYYINSYSSSIKTIFSVIFEQLLLIIAFYMLELNKTELNTIIKVIVWTAAVFYVIGIFESFTFIRPFDSLYTVSRDVLNDHYIRLGLLRATTTLGLPGIYGNMCILTFPLIMYMYSLTQQNRYIVISFLNINANIQSGSRSDLFFLIIVLVVYIVYVIRGNERRKILLKNSLLIFAAMGISITILSVTNPRISYFYLTTGKSLLNEIGFNYNLSESAPLDVAGYGENEESGTNSRLAQFSGISYTLKRNPLFGLGAKAPMRGDVQIYSYNHWHPSHTYDVGYVEILCDEGLFGFLGYISLFISIIIISINRTVQKKSNNCSRCIDLLIFSYLICMLSTANMYTFLFVIILIQLNYELIEKKSIDL